MGKSTISMAISHFSYAFNTCFIRGYCLAVEGRSQTLCLELRGKEGPKLSLRENTLAPGKRPDRRPDPRAQRAALASGSALRGTLPPMGHRQSGIVFPHPRLAACVPSDETLQVLIVKEPAPFTVNVVAVPYLKVQAGQTTAVGISQGQREQLPFALDR